MSLSKILFVLICLAIFSCDDEPTISPFVGTWQFESPGDEVSASITIKSNNQIDINSVNGENWEFSEVSGHSGKFIEIIKLTKKEFEPDVAKLEGLVFINCTVNDGIIQVDSVLYQKATAKTYFKDQKLIKF